MKNYTEDTIQANRLINQYYLLMDAADMILRESIRLIESDSRNLKLNGNFKMRHSQMMQSVRVMKNHHDKFEQDYRNAFSDYRVWDDMRKDSNTLARLSLLFSDRCYNDEETELKIEALIKNFPTKDCINEEIITKFKLK